MLDVLYVYSGAIFSTLLLAEPSLAQVFLNTQPLLVSLVCWYLVFYCPGDLFVRCLDAMHLRIPLAAMQDFLRIQLVRSGVDIILKEHPGTFVYPVVFSICKSSGFLFLKYAERLLKEPGASGAFVIPNVATKLCVLSSLLFTAQQNGVLSVEKDVLFAGAVIVAVVLRLFSALSSADPFALAEDFSCGLLFGRHHDDGREVTEVSTGHVQSATFKCRSELFRGFVLIVTVVNLPGEEEAKLTEDEEYNKDKDGSQM